VAGAGLQRRLAAVNRGVVRALALGQIVTALVLLLVAFVAVRNGSEVEALRAELADTRARLVAAEADRDRLQDRVDLLEQALMAAGIDPDTIIVEPSSTAPGPSSTTDAERRASSAPAGRETTRPRPAETEPAPQPQQPPPPEDPPDEPPPPEEEPCPVPELPIVGCPV
jgi:hypothetical protein